MRILSIDGGGILGLVPAMILAELERRSGRPCRELFDLMAGTSTGGIIVLALGLGIPAEELVTLYRDRAGVIFHRSLWRRLRYACGLTGPKYSGEGLQAELRAVFGESRLSDIGANGGGLVMVPAYRLDRSIRLFKSWRVGEVGQEDYRVCDVALATASAPTYFPPARIRDGGLPPLDLVDGGLFANNPAQAAFNEALKVGAGPRAILSLTTGETCLPIDPEAARSWGCLGWAVPVIESCMDGQSDMVDYSLRLLVAEQAYLRPAWRVPPGVQMDSADAESLAKLTEHGEAVCTLMDASGQFDQVLRWARQA